MDARDVGAVMAAGAVRAELTGKTLNVNGPAALDHDDIAALISKAVGREVKFVDVPDEQSRSTLLGYGMPSVLVDAISELNGVIRAGYTAYADDSVKQITGRDAHTFERYIADHITQFQ